MSTVENPSLSWKKSESFVKKKKTVMRKLFSSQAFNIKKTNAAFIFIVRLTVLCRHRVLPHTDTKALCKHVEKVAMKKVFLYILSDISAVLFIKLYSKGWTTAVLIWAVIIKGYRYRKDKAGLSELILNNCKKINKSIPIWPYMKRYPSHEPDN